MKYHANVQDETGTEHAFEADTLAVLADLVNDVAPGRTVAARDAAGFTRGWVGPSGTWGAA